MSLVSHISTRPMGSKTDIPGTLDDEGDDFDDEPKIVYESIGDVPQDRPAGLDSPPRKTSCDCDRPLRETIAISVLYTLVLSGLICYKDFLGITLLLQK
jgi:hypothetical protein